MSKLIGIAGPSCSGKTQLARWLSQELGAPMLNLDHYYLDLSHLTLEERARTNFDEPHSVDHDAIIEHAQALRGGQGVHAPRYDFARHTRAPGDEVIGPGEVVILEGLFAFCWPELRDLFDLKLFMEAPDRVCLERRLDRDVVEQRHQRASASGLCQDGAAGGTAVHFALCAVGDLVMSGRIRWRRPAPGHWRRGVSGSDVHNAGLEIFRGVSC